MKSCPSKASERALCGLPTRAPGMLPSITLSWKSWALSRLQRQKDATPAAGSSNLPDTGRNGLPTVGVILRQSRPRRSHHGNQRSQARRAVRPRSSKWIWQVCKTMTAVTAQRLLGQGSALAGLPKSQGTCLLPGSLKSKSCQWHGVGGSSPAVLA